MVGVTDIAITLGNRRVNLAAAEFVFQLLVAGIAEIASLLTNLRAPEDSYSTDRNWLGTTRKQRFLISPVGIMTADTIPLHDGCMDGTTCRANILQIVACQAQLIGRGYEQFLLIRIMSLMTASAIVLGRWMGRSHVCTLFDISMAGKAELGPLGPRKMRRLAEMWRVATGTVGVEIRLVTR
jgi:hypothetical protein